MRILLRIRRGINKSILQETRRKPPGKRDATEKHSPTARKRPGNLQKRVRPADRARARIALPASAVAPQSALPEACGPFPAAWSKTISAWESNRKAAGKPDIASRILKETCRKKQGNTAGWHSRLGFPLCFLSLSRSFPGPFPQVS